MADSDAAIRAIGAFAASIVGLAIFSVIFSPNAQAANVIGTAGQAFASIIGAATAPVSGGSVAPTINYTGTGTTGIGGFGGLGFATNGLAVNLTGLPSLINSVGNLSGGGSSGGNQNFVDSGNFDTGGSAASNDAFTVD